MKPLRIAAFLICCNLITAGPAANDSLAELSEADRQGKVIVDNRDTPDDPEDDRYWYSKEEEQHFEEMLIEEDLEIEHFNDHPDFSTAHWGPWVVVPHESKVVFERYHNSRLLFYGNPLIMQTIAHTPIGADVSYAEFEQEQEEEDFGDQLLLELERKDQPESERLEEEDEESEPAEKVMVINNPNPAGYEYQPVRKYTDVGVWVVVHPR